MKKRIVILWHNGGRLANQLWLYVSVFAYCLERGYRLENHCFFEYARQFELRPNNRAVELFYYRTHDFLKRHFSGIFFRDPHNGLFRKLYKVYVKVVVRCCLGQMVYASSEPEPKIRYLPPTPNASAEVLGLEANRRQTIYFSGWLFRNPVGLLKYHKEIVRAFRPKAEIAARTAADMADLRSRYKKVVGLHLRQGDYRNSRNPQMHCFTADEANAVVRQYISNFQVDVKTTCFLVCSDEPVDLSRFPGLEIRQSDRPVVEDLFLLASCDLVIGSNSTFGPFAAYYGDIPFITLQKDGMDWEYYRGRERFFFDKYATLVYY